MNALPLADRPTAVYRLFDAEDVLLYVGISCNPEARFKQHRTHQWWWPQVAARTIEWRPDRLTALKHEALAIQDEAPLYNHESPNPERVSLPKPCPAKPKPANDDFDFSVESFTEALGADVMEHIRQSVAAAPAPGPELVERMRSILAPAVARLSQHEAEHAEAA